MTILVKDVIITKRLGKIARPVKMITSLTGVDQSLPSASLVVTLSMTVIKSLMLGTVFVGALTPEVSPGCPGSPGCPNALAPWPKHNPAGVKTTNPRKAILISLPVIYIPNYYSFLALLNPLRYRLCQTIS
ncbi:hypothetical protein ES703_57484 [subsurface metagenome]